MSQIKQSAFPFSSFVDLSLLHVGTHECAPMHCYGPAIRNYYLFHYIRTGKGDFHYHNEKGEHISYRLGAGQGFFCWPGLQHTYIADKDEPWSYCWVGFDGVKAEGILAQTGINANQPIYTPHHKPGHQDVETAIMKIFDHRNGTHLELMGYLYLLLHALTEGSAHSKKVAINGAWEFYAQEIVVFIEENYHREIGMKDISALCNLDKNHLGKIFKNVMGATFRDYLIAYRINKASELMRNTHHTIGEISAMVGYTNMFNFSRAFKALIGESPRKWRERNRLM